MANKLEFPSHFEEESKALGATADQIRAGKRLAELYADNDPLVDVKESETYDEIKDLWKKYRSRIP